MASWASSPPAFMARGLQDRLLVLSDRHTAQAMGAKLGEKAIYDFRGSPSSAIPQTLDRSGAFPGVYARLKELWEKVQQPAETFGLGS